MPLTCSLLLCPSAAHLLSVQVKQLKKALKAVMKKTAKAPPPAAPATGAAAEAGGDEASAAAVAEAQAQLSAAQAAQALFPSAHPWLGGAGAAMSPAHTSLCCALLIARTFL